MKILKKILHGIDKISEFIGKIDSFILVIIILIVGFEVVMRYVFKSPTLWVTEGAGFLFGSYIVLGGAYIQLKKSHTAMDILYNKFSTRTKALVDALCFFLLALYCIALIWKGGERAIFAIKTNEHSTSLWAPSLIPIKCALPIGAFFMLLQGIAKWIRDIIVVVKGEEYIDF